ncbi:hypothetical protein B0H11DRAFT_1933938 [Mycena galericulata]|nr:hypothetical protein B0H11DRAFT_1933938 [Mycena galericulata]
MKSETAHRTHNSPYRFLKMVWTAMHARGYPGSRVRPLLCRHLERMTADLAGAPGAGESEGLATNNATNERGSVHCDAIDSGLGRIEEERIVLTEKSLKAPYMLGSGWIVSARTACGTFSTLVPLSGWILHAFE